MKARRLLIRLLGLLAACYATGMMTSAVWAAEAAKPPAKAAPPASESAAPKADEESSAPQSAAASQDDEDAEEQQAAAKPKASGKKGSPERFVPSEQVRADFDVSFPIDI